MFSPLRSIVFALGVAVLVLLRLIHLQADTPLAVGTGSMGVFVDEGYKTLDPRNLLLFGDRRWHPEDAYPGWMERSPLTQWPYWGAFRAFGVEPWAARTVTVGYFALFLLAYVSAARERYDLLVGVAGLALLGVQHTLFFFSRIALFELPVIVFLYGFLFLLARYRPGRTRTTLLLLLFAGVSGLGVKLSASFYFLPAAVGLGWAWWPRKVGGGEDGGGGGRRSRRELAGVVTLVATVAAAAGVMGWLFRGILAERIEPPEAKQLPSVLLNPLADSNGLLLAAALLCATHLLWTRPAKLMRDPYAAALFFLAVAGPFLFLAFPYTPLRYYLPFLPAFPLLVIEWLQLRLREPPEQAARIRWIYSVAGVGTLAWAAVYLGQAVNRQFLPLFDVARIEAGTGDLRRIAFFAPLALLGAVAAWWWRRRLFTPRRVTAAVVLLVGLAVVRDVVCLGDFFVHPTHDSRRIAAELDAALPAAASVAGDWAPFLTLGTGLRSLYLLSPENDVRRLPELRPDYFLFAGTVADRESLRVIREQLPTVSLGPPRRLGRYAGKEVVLHRLVYTEK
jgi:hypothetical protein